MELHFSLDDFARELSDLIRIPSISALSQNREQCFRVLEQVQFIVRPMQVETQIVQTKGNPVFVGTLQNEKSSEWLTIYNHMDVQPAEEPQWISKPFEPLVKDGKIIGRGATDDKGPALTIIHAIREMQKQNISLPNIQLVYETEEEIGSTNFGSFLDESLAKKIIQKPNSILVSDSEFEGEYPSVNYKLRGMVRVFLELETGTQEAHSGVTGGVAKNPLEILSRIIVSMKDEKGNITIPGYLDDVFPLSAKEIEITKQVASHTDVEKFKRETGLKELFTEDPEEMLTRIWHKPMIEMHGFEGVQYTPGVIKSAIPNKVVAKLTLRLVPGQTPERSVQRVREYVNRFHPGIIIRGDGQ
ncbi:MAG: M20/M25/M40 family metallo-hydrolase, partial [archaeon]